MSRMLAGLCLVVSAGLFAACAEPTEAPQPAAVSPEPTAEAMATLAPATMVATAEMTGTITIAFTKPADGDTVTSPVEVCLETTGIEIEAAGEVRPGYGHYHVVVDPTAEEIAQLKGDTPVAVAKDETHIHMGDGASCKEIELAAGEHVLMAVVADGAHMTLGPTASTDITVTAE